MCQFRKNEAQTPRFHDPDLCCSVCKELFYITRKRNPTLTGLQKTQNVVSHKTEKYSFRQCLIQRFRQSSGLQLHFLDIYPLLEAAVTTGGLLSQQC